MAILKTLKRLADRAFFLFFIWFLKPKSAEEKRLLLIRTDGIGDLVYFQQFVPLFAKAFPDHKLFLLCREECKGLAERLPLFDGVIFFKYMNYRWNYFYRLMVLMRIRRLGAQNAIYASYHRQHIGDDMTLLSGARETIAFQGNDEIIHPAMRRANDRYYSKVVQTKDHIPEDVKYRTLLREMGIRDVSVTTKLHLSQSADDAKVTANSSEPYFVMGVGGSSSLRRWPAENFSLLGDLIAEKTRWHPLITGSEKERGLLEFVAKRMKHGAEIISEKTLPEVSRLLTSAKLFLGNESGLLHMAASLGTPALGILGGGHFTRYFPYGSARIIFHKLPCYECNWKCPFPEPYCITNISVEDVMKELGRLKLLKTAKS